MRCSFNCRRTPLRLQPPPRKQYVNRRLSSLLDLPKKGRQAFQPRRRKHPGAPTSPPRRLCRQPRPRRVARDQRPATPRSTPRNSLLPTLIAASFFITCANSRTPLLNLLRQSALMERAALSGRRRHKAAHANGPISGRHTPRSPPRGGARLWLYLLWPHLPPLLPLGGGQFSGAKRTRTGLVHTQNFRLPIRKAHLGTTSDTRLFSGGGLNRSTQHFILKERWSVV